MPFNLCTFVKAEMLIRVEDLAFILCWADEAGWVIGFVVLTNAFYPFRLWYWTNLLGTNWHRSYSGNWTSSLGLAVQGALQRIFRQKLNILSINYAMTWNPCSPCVIPSKFELHSNTVWWIIRKWNCTHIDKHTGRLARQMQKVDWSVWALVDFAWHLSFSAMFLFPVVDWTVAWIRAVLPFNSWWTLMDYDGLRYRCRRLVRSSVQSGPPSSIQPHPTSL